MDQQPVRKMVSLRGVGRIGGFYIQRPQAEQQSHKPKLKSRFPSDPMSRPRGFLLPPNVIGVIPFDNAHVIEYVAFEGAGWIHT